MTFPGRNLQNGRGRRPRPRRRVRGSGTDSAAIVFSAVEALYRSFSRQCTSAAAASALRQRLSTAQCNCSRGALPQKELRRSLSTAASTCGRDTLPHLTLDCGRDALPQFFSAVRVYRNAHCMCGGACLPHNATAAEMHCRKKELRQSVSTAAPTCSRDTLPRPNRTREPHCSDLPTLALLRTFLSMSLCQRHGIAMQ